MTEVKKLLDAWGSDREFLQLQVDADFAVVSLVSTGYVCETLLFAASDT